VKHLGKLCEGKLHAQFEAGGRGWMQQILSFTLPRVLDNLLRGSLVAESYVPTKREEGTGEAWLGTELLSCG
jgi:hypothetical protein